MKISKLDKKTRTRVRAASREEMEKAMSRCKVRHLPNGRWLGAKNRYRERTADRIEKDSSSQKIRKQSYREYLACSAPGHLEDGWCFLGRACDAILRGDPQSAVHFAYYAELRAAAAQLASVGIGLMRSKHASVERGGDVKVFPGGNTHKFVWPALHCWSATKSAQKLILKSVRVKDLGVDAWIDGFHAGINGAAIAQRWLDVWGMDLRQVHTDHISRNEVSYRPSVFRSKSSLTAGQALGFVVDLWALFEPRNGGYFDLIDSFLLRRAVEQSFRGSRGKKAVDDPVLFAADVAKLCQTIGLDLTQQNRWTSFLCRHDRPIDPGPFSRAEESHASDDGVLALQMISRAALLLRLATGSVRHMLESSGVGNSLIEFWWKPLGEARGLWPKGRPPAQVEDIWSDINQSMSDAMACLHNSPQLDFNGLRKASPPFSCTLGSFEAVSLWGLAS